MNAGWAARSSWAAALVGHLSRLADAILPNRFERNDVVGNSGGRSAASRRIREVKLSLVFDDPVNSWSWRSIILSRHFEDLSGNHLNGTHSAETADECAIPINRRAEKSTPWEGEERKEYAPRAYSAADPVIVKWLNVPHNKVDLQYSRYGGVASSFWFRTELRPWLGLSILQTSLILVLEASKWSSIGSKVSYSFV